ncbi:MAG: peptide chain release factor 1 [Clostridia bacterium]|nr:peptide chain release factor 1 [Clostridia bacterium]
MEQFNGIIKRYREVIALLCEPSVLADPERTLKLTKESKTLEPMVTAIEAVNAADERIRQAKELLADADMRELAHAELAEAQQERDAAWNTLQELSRPKDPRDERAVIVEIRAGTGGEESALFAADLYRMYAMFAENHGLTIEPLFENETELGGFKEISFLVNGDGAWSRFRFESGVHRVQRVPETESGGRIHTSAATVAVLPEADPVEVDIRPEDLKIDTYRSSGAGGQHINKTESAIRITHLPTGLVVECQDERSQYKNKDKAMRVLRSRLLEQKQAEQQTAIASDRQAQVGSGDRSERIRTYNFPQGRVTDHRIGLTLYQLPAILNGGLEPLVDALLTADRTDQLKGKQI